MLDCVEYHVKLGEQCKNEHTMFLRQHRVRDNNSAKPAERTLFVGGVPPFVHEKNLKSLFGQFGDIEAVYLHKNPSPKCPAPETSIYFRKEQEPKGYKVAYVVFANSNSLESALDRKHRGIMKKSELTCGTSKWACEFNSRIPDIRLQNEIDEFMSNYDESEADRQRKEKTATEADDEGWITVTKKSRKPGFARKESVMKQISEKLEQRRKKKELSNFYRFQIKESKLKNLVALRQKFEEDKKRISALKATRRFKPF